MSDQWTINGPINDPKDKLIVALDFAFAPVARVFLDKVGDACRWVKVGMELYYAEGMPFVHELRRSGYGVFLDLKLHDIPKTVAGAVTSATRAGASLLTVHASGGGAMMKAAVAASQGREAPRLLAVTVLTSMDATELASTGVAFSPADQVVRLARLAWQSGIRGMVCSPAEVALLRAEFGEEAELIVPGIRPTGADLGDQKRVATPSEAIERGASRIVVGRPINLAPDPKAAVEAILEEIAGVSATR